MAEQSKLAFLKAEADRLAAKHGEENPFVKDLRRQIAGFDDLKEPATRMFGATLPTRQPDPPEQEAARLLGDSFEKALGLAARLHSNQVRKGTSSIPR